MSNSKKLNKLSTTVSIANKLQCRRINHLSPILNNPLCLNKPSEQNRKNVKFLNISKIAYECLVLIFIFLFLLFKEINFQNFS